MKSEFEELIRELEEKEDMIKYNHDPYERLKFYSNYHEWSKEFVDNIKYELNELLKNNK